MLKKITLSGITLFLMACSSTQHQDPIPAEFAGADYQLLDVDAKRWVEIGSQVEQCVYPNITRIQHAHFPKEDAYVYSQYVFFYPLEEVIGEDNVKIIQNDAKSMDYVSYQFKKFRGEKAKPMDADKCEILRQQARDDLAVVKGEHRTAMVEEKNNTDDSAQKTKQDKVATNDNRFFFDIIKWGSMLML